MGIFDYFRKKPEKKALNFNEIDKFISEKREELKNNDKKLTKIISNYLTNFLEEIKKEREILKNINLDEKKVEDRIRNVAKVNLEDYVNYLEKLILRLNSLNYSSYTDLGEKISNEINDFLRVSRTSYERATLLIGKEIEAVNISIKTLKKNLFDIFNENLETSKLNEVFDKTLVLMLEMKEISKNNEQFIQESVKINNNIENIKDIIKQLENKITKVRASEAYKKIQQKNNENNNKRRRLEEEYLKLRNSFDFKDLARKYHSNEKMMKLLSMYKEDVELIDKERALYDLASLDIQRKVYELRALKKEIDSFSPEKDEVISIISEIQILENRIRDNEKERVKLTGIIAKNEDKIKHFKDEIRNIFSLIKIEIL